MRMRLPGQGHYPNVPCCPHAAAGTHIGGCSAEEKALAGGSVCASRPAAIRLRIATTIVTDINTKC